MPAALVAVGALVGMIIGKGQQKMTVKEAGAVLSTNS